MKTHTLIGLDPVQVLHMGWNLSKLPVFTKEFKFTGGEWPSHVPIAGVGLKAYTIYPQDSRFVECDWKEAMFLTI